MSSINNKIKLDFLGAFSQLEDPRTGNATLHRFDEILILSLSACLAGADNFVAMERFAKAKKELFELHLDLKNGIPSHDTFGNVFAAIDPEKFNACFMQWTSQFTQKCDEEVIAIDGKSLRRSHDHSKGKPMVHIVNAWASEYGCVLGQYSVEGKSNEIKAIPKLLEMLLLDGCIVTIDAMGTQREIAPKIIKGGADYILCLKDNHPTFHEEVRDLFSCAETLLEMKKSGVNIDFIKDAEKSHGREEIRKCVVVEDVSWYKESWKWEGLRSLIMVERVRKEGEKETSIDQHYYITSLGADARKILKSIRKHWSIENSLHWVLDVSWSEDQSRVRNGNAAQNLSLLRKSALNLHKKSSRKDSLKGKIQIAGWDNEYLKELIGF